jgi:5'-nucleotidase
MSKTIPILTFNDVYRVSQKYVPQPGAPSYTKSDSTSSKPDEITVSQFAQKVYELRDAWDDREETIRGDTDGEKVKDGIVLFAGDVFNPSVESSVTRGSHMVSMAWRGELMRGTDFECSESGLCLCWYVVFFVEVVS